jgi:DNA-binding NarL/FixJ family response regulator
MTRAVSGETTAAAVPRQIGRAAASAIDDGRPDPASCIIRIAVIDDQPIFLAGLMRTLETAPDFQIVASGTTGTDAIRIATACAPDVLILDLRASSDGTSVEPIETIASVAPTVRMLVVTGPADNDRNVAAMLGGASGLLRKDVCASDLIRIVRTVHLAGCCVTPALLARVASRPRHVLDVGSAPRPARAMLNVRERQILSFLAKGFSNTEIGLKLTLSDKTIKHYVTGLLQKLRVRNRTQAAIVASHAPYN